MGNIDLGGKPTPTASPEKEKMIYLNIPTALMLILDCKDFEPAGKYTDAMKRSLEQTLNRVELRKEILRTCGVKSSGKLKKTNKQLYDRFTDMFGKSIWG